MLCLFITGMVSACIGPHCRLWRTHVSRLCRTNSVTGS